MKSIHFSFGKIISISILTFLLIASCDVTDPKKDRPKPEGYQEDIPWPSLEGVPWPMHHGNPQFNGRSKFAGPQFGKIEWQVQIPSTGFATSFLSPVIGKDGTIYFVSFMDVDDPGSFLYAMSSKGKIKWRYSLSTFKNTSPPIITTDNKIYVSDWAKNVSCLDTSGSLIWKITLNKPIRSIMNIDKTGNLYGMAADGVLYSFTPDGNIRWQIKISGFGPTSDAIAFAPDGNTLYLKNRYTGLYAISTSGEIIWKYTGSNFEYDYIAPLVTSQGEIFLTSGILPVKSNGVRDSVLYYKIFEGIGHRYVLSIEPTIDRYGNFYIASDNFIISFDYRGNVRWEKNLEKDGLWINEDFGLISDMYGKVYFMDNYNILYCFNSEGTEIWRLQLDGASYYSPAIYNGRMYLGTVMGKIKYFYSIM